MPYNLERFYKGYEIRLSWLIAVVSVYFSYCERVLKKEVIAVFATHRIIIEGINKRIENKIMFVPYGATFRKQSWCHALPPYRTSRASRRSVRFVAKTSSSSARRRVWARFLLSSGACLFHVQAQITRTDR